MQDKVQLPSMLQPDVFARSSSRVQKANQYLLQCIQQIQDKALVAIVEAMLAPLHGMDSRWLLLDNAAAQKNAPGLCKRLATPIGYNAWWGAPGAASTSHHCYPGGWLMHNATNLYSLRMLVRTVVEMREVPINSDALLAGMLLHDALKPRLFLWENGELTVDQGEYGHHVAALAEAYLQGASAETLYLLAGVHVGWWKNSQAIEGFLDRAAQLLDEPPLARASVAPQRVDFLPETWIMRQGEEAWYSATKTAIQEVKPRLRKTLEQLFPEEQCTAAEWWVLAHCDELELVRNIADGTLEETVRKVLLGVTM